MSYGDFAHYYDALTQNVDYSKRTDDLLCLFTQYGPLPNLLLDAACGTGSFSFEFQKRGIDVIGVDASPDMLSVARQKAAQLQSSPFFLCQRLSELDLFGTVNGAVCTLDSVNHITEPGELAASFSRISLFLEPGSLFLFDANTAYKHETVLGDKTFVYDLDEVFCVWQNSYDPDTRNIEIFLDFFAPHGELYQRCSEDFSECFYSDDQFGEMLEQTGFSLLAIVDEASLKAPGPLCERKIYIARKN